MADSLRIVVTGLIAQYPLGGVAWDYGQYVDGLRRMGHDVFYIEDTGQWPYNPIEGGVSEAHEFNVTHLADVMSQFDMSERWAYRFPRGARWYGMSEKLRTSVCATADLVLNVSGVLRRPEEYRHRARLVYIDSDPVFTQVKLLRGQQDFRALVDEHDVLFSFGERLGRVPDLATGHDWKPTRQPIVLDAWRHDLSARPVFTTVMNWSSFNPIRYGGRTYGQKDAEFDRIIDMPSRLPFQEFEIAVAAGKVSSTPTQRLRRHGWRLVDPNVVCGDLGGYRTYIQTSLGEFAVAKNGYVIGDSGWFSCRSACYLAAGRPVVVQNTGFSRVLPVGEGVVGFCSPDEARDAIEDVRLRYREHQRAAREIAQTYFDSGAVLGSLLARAFAGSGPVAAADSVLIGGEEA